MAQIIVERNFLNFGEFLCGIEDEKEPGKVGR
jgi:hypothetical protein